MIYISYSPIGTRNSNYIYYDTVCEEKCQPNKEDCEEKANGI